MVGRSRRFASKIVVPRQYSLGEMLRTVTCGLLISLAACAGQPHGLDEPHELLQGEGVRVTQEPQGETVGAPGEQASAVRDGTVLVFRRGGDRFARLQVEVDESGDLLRFVDTDSGLQTLHSRQLAEIGRDAPRRMEGEEAVNFPLLRLVPGDPWIHFPLGVGKQWTAEIASHAPNRGPGLLTIDYHCDGRELVETSAGRFDCFRIWRVARRSGDQGGRARTSLYWYAPELGFIVRRLDDSELLELEAVATKSGSPSAESEPRIQD